MPESLLSPTWSMGNVECAPAHAGPSPEVSLAACAKRILDLIVALPALILLMPFFCVLSLAICVDSPGPPLYAQVRLGRKLRPFRMYKFRTMADGAEQWTGPVWAAPDDPRITNLGRLLRRWHLDELPQLVNVIRGEMSLVGPRPERPTIARDLECRVRGYLRRNSVLPGITGLAQIRSGYDSSVHTVRRKLRYDLIYIHRRCLLLDLAILFATARHVMSGGVQSPSEAGEGVGRVCSKTMRVANAE